MASKYQGLDLINTQADRQVDMELAVQLSVSVLCVDKPHCHRELRVQHQVLHPEYLETDGLMVP